MLLLYWYRGGEAGQVDNLLATTWSWDRHGPFPVRSGTTTGQCQCAGKKQRYQVQPFHRIGSPFFVPPANSLSIVVFGSRGNQRAPVVVGRLSPGRTRPRLQQCPGSSRWEEDSWKEKREAGQLQAGCRWLIVSVGNDAVLRLRQTVVLSTGSIAAEVAHDLGNGTRGNVLNNPDKRPNRHASRVAARTNVFRPDS